MSTNLEPLTQPSISLRLVQDEDVAIAVVDGWIGSSYYQSTGSSRRDPEDNVCVETGAKLAIGRALRQIGRDILHDGQDHVRYHDNVARQQREASEEARKRKDARAKQIKKSLKKS